MFTLLTPARVAAGLLAVYVMTLCLGYGREKGFLIDADGTRRPIEFIAVKAAGDLAKAGRAADAYDWDRHKVAHDAAIGKATTDFYPWPYPPNYLVVADALARLPYVSAALLFLGLTALGYALTASALWGNRRGALYALGAPTTMINASIAHTGFLVAGLFGGALYFLRRRPIVAGVLLGLLTFKPQLGLLVPVALIAGGHWRVIAAATVTASAMVALSLGLYGLEPWLAMPAQLARVTTDVLMAGQVNFNMLTTPYGLIRRLDAGHGLALAVQGVATMLLIAAVAWLWRSTLSDDLKAAGLLAASVIATPYLFIYDLTVVVMALLFLARHVGAEGFDRRETVLLIASGLLVMGFAMAPLPLGMLGAALACGVIAQRIAREAELGRRIARADRTPAASVS